MRPVSVRRLGSDLLAAIGKFIGFKVSEARP